MSNAQQVCIHLELLRAAAVEAGLIAGADELHYSRGSRTNGNAPQVFISPAGSGLRQQPAFLPRFTLKHTAADVSLALEAAWKTLQAVARTNSEAGR